MTVQLPPLPGKMYGLREDARGYPVPWFVPWQDGEPVFPAMDPDKLVNAINQQRCWVCGGRLKRLSAYVVGPMCAVNRTSAEPPSHIECARFSARACPFLSRPAMRRIPKDRYVPAGITPSVAGIALERNPGVVLLWVIKGRCQPYRLADGGILFNLGDPYRVEFYAEGREATRAEILASIESGLPHLAKLASEDPDPAGAAAELRSRVGCALELLPAA